jgi:hypothetical protein
LAARAMSTTRYENTWSAVGVCDGRPTFKYTRIEITGTMDRLIRDVLREEETRQSTRLGPKKGFLKTVSDFFGDWMLQFTGVGDWAKKLLDAFETQGGAYISCFCKNGDLLSQWRGYGATGGGYALGFLAGQLDTPPTEQPIDKMMVRRVIYNPSVQKRMVQHWIDSFSQEADTQKPARPTVQMAQGETSTCIRSRAFN